MSATELKDRTLRALDAEIDAKVHLALQVRYSAGAHSLSKAGVLSQAIPPTSIEEIALSILETNSFRRGLDRAREIIVQQHQQLVTPDSIPSELGEEEKDGAESIY